MVRPQPSPQSSVTSGISVGGSSVSNSAESPLTAASPKPHLIQTSDLSTSSPSSSSPPPNDRDNDHVFYNPCNSVRAEAFFTSHTQSDLCNSSNPSNFDSTLDDSQDASHDPNQYVNFSYNDSNRKPKYMVPEIKSMYSNIDPYTQHSTNILIRYHNSDRENVSSPSSNSSSSAPVPAPRSSVISSVLSNDASTHIVQSYGPAYANTYFPNNRQKEDNTVILRSTTSPSTTYNHNTVGLPPLDSNSNISSGYPNSYGHGNASKAYSGSNGFASAGLIEAASKLSVSSDGSNYHSNLASSTTNGQHFLSDLPTSLEPQRKSTFKTNSDNYYVGRVNVPNNQKSNRNWISDQQAHSFGANANSGPQMLKETNWEPTRNGRVWTNSHGRNTPVRPSLSRQVSIVASQLLAQIVRNGLT